MKIVNIIGGLGNQMFQYAFALSLKKKFPNEEVLIDVSHFHTLFFHDYKGMNLHQGYELEKTFPNISLKKAGIFDLVSTTWYMPNYLLSRIVRKCLPKRKSEVIQKYSDTFKYLPELYKTKGNTYYEGYWQSIKYVDLVREELTIEFQHPTPNAYNETMIARIKNTNSVGIHVRRGDYVTNIGFGGICELDYYQNAISKMGTDSKTFFIFSNDISWCKENIQPLLKSAEVIYVIENKGKDSFWDMFLMSYCKSLIIANSSFSWWGAVLNRNRNPQIIAPKKWNNQVENVDLYCDDWILI